MPTMAPAPVKTPDLEENLLGAKEEEEKITNELVLEKPQLNDPEKNDSVVTVANMSQSGIKVVATRKGFYNQTRISEGQSFIIRSFEEVAEWMSCVDPIIEKKRIQFIKDKKAKK